MTLLLLTKKPATVLSILGSGGIDNGVFVTPCMLQAKEYAKLFNPDRIMISDEFQDNENMQLLKSWPLVHTRKFEFLESNSVLKISNPENVTDKKKQTKSTSNKKGKTASL